MFWKRIYKSKYTGAEIDAAVAKAGDATKVTANPTLAGTEAALTGLEVGDTKYKVEQPINVVANPTLAGTETALEGLEVGDTKYKVEQPINVVANPTLAGTEATLAGLQVGSTKYKVGGDDIFVFYVSQDDNTGHFVFSKTYTEIRAAINDGKVPIGFEEPSSIMSWPEGFYLMGMTENLLAFMYTSFDFDTTFTANKKVLQLDSSNSITVLTDVLYTWAATLET